MHAEPELRHPLRFLLDFEVETHGCLSDGQDQIKIGAFDGKVDIHISNLHVQPGTDRPLLSVQIIQTADDIEHAKEEGTANLQRYLRYLAFASNLPFRIHKLVRVIDWTLGLKQRVCHQFERFPGSGLPYPVLERPIFESLEQLTSIATTPALDRALKWFSAGVGADYTDDQFQYFWLVIELLSQIDKPSDRVHDACPKCKEKLFCQACNEHPTHRPYPKQAIRHLFERTMDVGAADFFSLASDIRNAIMHGEDVAAIERGRGVELTSIVDTLGNVAWTALLNTLLKRPEDRERVEKLALLRTDTYGGQILTLKAHLTVYTKDPNNPTLSEIAKPDISLVRHGELAVPQPKSPTSL